MNNAEYERLVKADAYAKRNLGKAKANYKRIAEEAQKTIKGLENAISVYDYMKHYINELDQAQKQIAKYEGMVEGLSLAMEE